MIWHMMCDIYELKLGFHPVAVVPKTTKLTKTMLHALCIASMKMVTTHYRFCNCCVTLWYRTLISGNFGHNVWCGWCIADVGACILESNCNVVALCKELISTTAWTHPWEVVGCVILMCYKQVKRTDCSVLPSINQTKTLFIAECYVVAKARKL
jgi:hypothetical protein